MSLSTLYIGCGLTASFTAIFVRMGSEYLSGGVCYPGFTFSSASHFCQHSCLRSLLPVEGDPHPAFIQSLCRQT